MAVKVELPYEYFQNPDVGRPVAGGSLYVGVKDLDPTILANQITVTARQEDGTELAIPQPISLSAGGTPLYNGSPVMLLVDVDHSLTVLDSLGAQVYTAANAGLVGPTVNDDKRYGVVFVNVAALTSATPTDIAGKSVDLQSGMIVYTSGYTTVGDGGGARYLIQTAAEFGGTPDGFGDHALANGNVAVLQVVGKIRISSQYGAVGDYVPSTDTGTDSTAAMQALFDAVEDGDVIEVVGNVMLDRDSAVLKAIDGVTSYVCVVAGKKDITFRTNGAIYLRHNALDVVAVGFDSCDGTHFENPVIDGNFRYVAGQPISYKQQLIHIIACTNSTGDLTVRNCSNVGYLISSDYGTPFDEVTESYSGFGTITSENCGQNSTFGTGVNRVHIDTFICKNPVLSAIKLSSRADVAAPAGAFTGVSIGRIVCGFTSDYVIPDNEADTALNDYLNCLDFVSQAGDVHVGSVYVDWENANVGITSNAVKHYPQEIGDLTNGTGVMSIGEIQCYNQSEPNSAVISKDNESGGLKIGTIITDGSSKIIEITNQIPAATAIAKALKWLDVDWIKVTGSNRAGINVLNWDADFIRVGRYTFNGLTAFTQQAIRIDATCDINDVLFPDLDVDSVVTILGLVNNRIELGGRINSSAQAADPLTVSMSSSAATLVWNELSITGDNNASRKCLLNNVSRVEPGKTILSNIPQGIACNNFGAWEGNCWGSNAVGLTVAQPWQFGGTLGTITGVFNHTGSPNSTQIADIGALYNNKNGELYKKKTSSGDALNWTVL